MLCAQFGRPGRAVGSGTYATDEVIAKYIVEQNINQDENFRVYG
jgi:hypothetical protein